MEKENSLNKSGESFKKPLISPSEQKPITSDHAQSGSDKLKKKTIEKLKETFEGNEIIDDDDTFEDIKKKRLKIGTNNLIFAELIFFCHSNFQNQMNSSKIEKKKILKELENYLKNINIENIRKIYSNLGDGLELGDHYNKINLDKEIAKNRRTYEGLINNFFAIFEEES